MRQIDAVRMPVCSDLSAVVRIHAALCSAFDQGSCVEIDIADVAEADLSVVQLIESARKTAALKGVSLRLSQPAHGSVLEVLRRGGFLESGDASRSEFWLQGASNP